MSKYLVLSDSHGRTDELDIILEKERGYNGVFYLGDGIRDVLMPNPRLSGRAVYSVRSLSDRGGNERPLELTLNVDGVNIYLCHGDHLPTDVKLGYASLLTKGFYSGAELCFFGHTHRQTLERREGLTLFNPGAVKDGKYGVLYTDNGTFRLEHKSLW